MTYMREGPQPEPMLQLDEVTKPLRHKKEILEGLCHLTVHLFLFFSSLLSCSQKKTLWQTLDFHQLSLKI